MPKPFNLLDINSVRPEVSAVLKFKKSGSALDLGCGIGRHSLFLAKKGFRVTAVDASSGPLIALKELARLQKLPIKIVHTDAVAYKPTKKFDVILLNMVLHFLPRKEQPKLLHAMQTATSKGGLNVVSSYTNKTPKGTRPHPIKPGSLKTCYEQAGWKILHYKEGKGQRMPDLRNPKKTIQIWTEQIIAQKVK